jgi:hypothetical protein
VIVVNEIIKKVVGRKAKIHYTFTFDGCYAKEEKGAKEARKSDKMTTIIITMTWLERLNGEK